MNSLDRSVARTLRGLAAGLGLGACIATLRGAESTQTAVPPGRAAAQSATRVGQWEPFELSMTANHDFANAYVETLPDDKKAYGQVTFAGTSGEAKGLSSIVTGFWNGGKDWKARFAPPAPGDWSYSSTSSDAGLQGVQGSFQCTSWTAEEKAANPARHGFVRVVSQGPRAARHFEYADGMPFLWIGDTWWAWARNGAPIERFQQVVDDRSSRGFSVGQYMYCANNASRLVGRDFSTPDFESIHNAERMIAYANSKGITLWIGAWWSAKDLDQQAGPEKIRRWWRYTIQRLAAYNVMWNIAGEYNMYTYGGLGLQFWKDTGALIRKEPRLEARHQIPQQCRYGDQQQFHPGRVSPGAGGVRHLDGLWQPRHPDHRQHYL